MGVLGAIDATWLIEKLLLLPPLLLSLAVHELAHARTALAFGDPTARNMGRCSLNPLVHLDPIGTLAIIFTGFGWAKPVPVNPQNLHPPRWGDIAVSLAGPLSNLTIALLIGFGLRGLIAAGVTFHGRFGDNLLNVILFTLTANVCLFVFNMLPIYPLDGHHIAREQLPVSLQAPFMRWQVRYGMPVLMLLMFGPMLAEGTHLRVPDPLRWVFNHAMDTMMTYVIAPGAAK